MKKLASVLVLVLVLLAVVGVGRAGEKDIWKALKTVKALGGRILRATTRTPPTPS